MCTFSLSRYLVTFLYTIMVQWKCVTGNRQLAHEPEFKIKVNGDKYEHLSQSIDTALGDFVHVTIKPSDK